MTIRSRLVLAALAALALTGCSKVSSKFCAMNPDDARCAGADAAVPLCAGDPDCRTPTPVCHLASSTCVQCVGPDQDDACMAATPVCGDNNTCRGCTAHLECASAVCLPDGRCASEAAVAYVEGGKLGAAPCDRTTPCGTLAEGVAANRAIIKLTGDVRDDQPTIIEGRAVTILADPGATLDRDGDGTILEVRSADADVQIIGLGISGGTGLADPAIRLTADGGIPKLTLVRVVIANNQGSAIANVGGALTVSRSTIATNQGGGISVTGTGATFDLTNNFIFRNGNQDSGTYGALALDLTSIGTNRLEFNTIVDNRAAAGSTRAGGVICDITGFTAPNNIIARNALGTDTTALTSQTLGNCTYPSSLVQPTITGLDFVASETAPYSYKLGATSTAIDQATTSSPIVIDHDGEARPARDEKDIGADELVP